MEVAKISSKGQVTLPIDIRKALKLFEGGKVAFVEENGKYFIVNSTMIALKTAQKDFEGEAERANLKTEDDVVEMIKLLRKEKGKE